MAKINRDIEVWYGRIAKNNEVSLAEAKQLLNAKELKEFKWTLEEYIKYGKENGISGDWSKQLENASARVHIERLEALKLQVRGQIEKLYNGRESGFESYLKNIYKDQYNHTAFQIAKGTGVGTNLYKLNDKLVGEVIKKPWAPDGKNFSERIWGDKNRLINTLHTELTQGFIRGDSIKEMTDNISKKMNVSKSNIERLVRTESAAYASKAKKQSFIDLGVEKFEVVATLDTRTSEICQDMDGKVFDMKDYEVGVTAPPYHINCRSTTAPYFEDEEDDTRAMRNPETGKTEYVPANMKYKEWEEKYLKDRVEKEEKSGIISIEELKKKVEKINLETATADDLIKIGKEIDTMFDIKSNIGNKEKLKEIFSNFREMGGVVPETRWELGDIWDKDRSLQVKKQLTEAFEYYPKDWANILEKTDRSLYVRMSGRGYFIEGVCHPNRSYSHELGNMKDKYLTIVTDGSRKTTPYHEIGHMVEWYNKDIKRIEKQWLEMRTKGEKEISLNDLFPSFRYKADEVVKKDNFICPYIGKIYEDGATEVLSMGLQGIFEPNELFLKEIDINTGKRL